MKYSIRLYYTSTSRKTVRACINIVAINLGIAISNKNRDQEEKYQSKMTHFGSSRTLVFISALLAFAWEWMVCVIPAMSVRLTVTGSSTLGKFPRFREKVMVLGCRGGDFRNNYNLAGNFDSDLILIIFIIL